MSAQPKVQPIKKQRLTGFSDYTPYSLSDYKNIAKTNYYMLGGLGPAHVGTTEWVHEENKRRRRQDYAKRLFHGSLDHSYLTNTH